MRKMLLILVLLAGAESRAAEGDGLARELEPLRPFLGKTWRSEFKASTPQNPLIDVSRWERALNGQAVRVVHSLNDGAYGGESIIRWNAERKTLEYFYFTTAGFMTQGTMTTEPGKLISHEKVIGSAGGVSEVKGVMEMLPDGRFRVTSEHLRDGKWGAGRDAVYAEAPEAKVTFK